jgi:ethanolaminephosphotransferase
VLLLLFGILDSAGVWLKAYSWGSAGWPSALGDGVYQVGYMFFSMGVAAGVYGSFVVDVVQSICEYLDIWCLVIKHPWTGDEEFNGVLREGRKAK